jgi:hypothetical protein
MDKKLQRIRHKVSDIQLGLLRFMDEGQRISLLVKAARSSEDNSLNCVLVEDAPGRKFLNKDVNFVQRSHNDYLFVRGKISQEARNGSRFLSLSIEKACWFVRRSRGHVTWLQETCTYINLKNAG